MSKIFSIRPLGPSAVPDAPAPATRTFRDVLRLVDGAASVDDFRAALPATERNEALLRPLAERYGFERLPATWCELYALFEYCDSLDAASGAGMMAPDQLAAWREASFVVWQRKHPQRMPAIERYCAGDLDGLRALHRQEDTLTQLGLRYLASM